MVARGYCSVSFLAAYQERVEAHANQLPLVLYLGDHDPSGVQMQDANQQTLADELGCEVEFKRVALLAEDVVRYDLPVNPDALKKTDTRAGAFVAQYGEVAVELDALPPATLVERIQQAIEENLDLPAFNRQVELWRSETAELEQRRRIAMDALGMTA